MNTLYTLAPLVLFMARVLFIMIIADFVSGVIHWWEDTYGKPEWKFLGIGKYLIIPNLIHHQKPRDFVKHSYLKRNLAAIILAIVLTPIIYLLTDISWQTALLLFIYGSQTVEIHAISHRTDKENGKFLVLLQKIGLLQSKKNHAQHHQSPHRSGYCLMTNWVNPILDSVKLWPVLEFFVWVVFKVPVAGDHGRF